jgi:hypothetical protein
MLPILNYFPCIDLCDQLLVSSDDFLSWFDGRWIFYEAASVSGRIDILICGIPGLVKLRVCSMLPIFVGTTLMVHYERR